MVLVIFIFGPVPSDFAGRPDIEHTETEVVYHGVAYSNERKPPSGESAVVTTITYYVYDVELGDC